MTTEKNVTPVVTKTTEQTTVLSLTNMPKFNNAAEEYAWLKAYEKQTKDRRDAEKKAEKQLKERQKEIEAAAAAEALKQDIAIFQAKDTNVQVNIRWTPKNGFPDGRKEGYKTLKPEMSEAIAAAISQVLKAYFSDPF